MLTSRLAISFVLKGNEEGDGGEKKKKRGAGRVEGGLKHADEEEGIFRASQTSVPDKPWLLLTLQK